MTWSVGIINAALKLHLDPFELLDAMELHNIPIPSFKYWNSIANGSEPAFVMLPRDGPTGSNLEFGADIDRVTWIT